MQKGNASHRKQLLSLMLQSILLQKQAFPLLQMKP